MFKRIRNQKNRAFCSWSIKMTISFELDISATNKIHIWISQPFLHLKLGLCAKSAF